MSDWQPIETAPKSEPYWDAPRVLVFGKCGIQMGRVIHFPDGSVEGRAEGFHGEWEITMWQPLPSPPTSTE